MIITAGAPGEQLCWSEPRTGFSARTGRRLLARRAGMTQPALSRLEAGGVIPTIPLLERITAALDVDLIVEISPHAA